MKAAVSCFEQNKGAFTQVDGVFLPNPALDEYDPQIATGTQKRFICFLRACCYRTSGFFSVPASAALAWKRT